jgi:hypothetical protein
VYARAAAKWLQTAMDSFSPAQIAALATLVGLRNVNMVGISWGHNRSPLQTAS